MADPLRLLYWETLREEIELYRRMTLEAGPPAPAPKATLDLLGALFDRPAAALKFSEQLSALLSEAGVKLADDETFVCSLYVAKKPTYAAEVMDPTPEPARPQLKMAADSSDTDFPFTELVASAWRAIRYKKIMVPAVMKAIAKKMERDKIVY